MVQRDLSPEKFQELENKLASLQTKLLVLKEGSSLPALNLHELHESEDADLLANGIADGKSPYEIARKQKWPLNKLGRALEILSERGRSLTHVDGHTAMARYDGVLQEKVTALRAIQTRYEAGTPDARAVTETYVLQQSNPLDPTPIDPTEPTTKTIRTDVPAHNGVSTSEYLKAIQQEADLIAKYIEVGQKLGVIYAQQNDAPVKVVQPTQVNVEIVMGDLIREATRRQDVTVLKRIADGDLNPQEAEAYLGKLKTE